MLSIWFLACTSSPVMAQSDNSTISGTIIDPAGAAVANAAVTVKSELTGVERQTTSNGSGYYVFTNLPSGLYAITVEAHGFQRLSKTNNKLDPSLPLTANLAMQVGEVSQSVEVTAESQALQADSATLGRIVTNNQAQNLPLNGRDPIYLALTKAGVTSATSTLSSFNFGFGLGGLNINGGRERDNLVAFDGAVGVRVRASGDTVGMVDLDAVQEVQILTANYGAEYGRSTGGQVRMITKGGTNRFHGSVYEYLRNPALDANTWARNTNPGTRFVAPYTFNQFGFNVGGPVAIPQVLPKGKVFFFYSEAFVRYPQVQTNMQTVPTDAFRHGDFSALLTPNPLSGLSPIYLKDPNSPAPCTAKDTTGCFANNIIPKNRLSPNGVALLNAFPAPTPGFLPGTNNLLQTGRFTQNQQTDSGSLDILPTEKHYIRFRLANFNYNDFEPFFGNFNLTPRLFDRPNQTASVNYVWTISPTMTNEVLLTGSHDHASIAIDTKSGLFNRALYGINYPYLFPDGKTLPNKIPTIQLNDKMTTLDGGPYPSHSGGFELNLADNITKVTGNHTLKAGVAFERAGENDDDQIVVQNSLTGQTNNQNGQFTFLDSRPGGTGYGIANAALGLFTSYAEVGSRAETPYRGNTYEFFLQDSYKATPKLHLDYGVRYTIIQPFYSPWNNMAAFDPAFYNPATAVQVNPVTGNPIPGTGDPLDGLVLLGDGFSGDAKKHVPIAVTGQYDNLFHHLPRGYADTHYNGLQPRVGIAYAFNNKTVLRAGAGRYIMRQGVSDGVFLGGISPFQQAGSVATGSVDNPGSGSIPLVSGTIDRSSPQPEAYAWNASFERELGFDTVVNISYVGRRGLHGQLERNINQPAPGTVQANPGININALRPYKGYSAIIEVSQGDSSRYNGLQVDLNRRFTKGLGYGLAYTYAKTTDCGSFQKSFLPNAFDPAAICGPADFDIRNALVINTVYELPFLNHGNSMFSKILGGWQVTMATQFQSGSPFSVATTSKDQAGVGPGGGPQLLNVTPGADLSGPRQFSNSPTDSNYWFRITNPDGTPIYSLPTLGTFSTQRNRNILRNPGTQTWNTALLKNFRLFEGQTLAFRVDAFNFINHPNLAAADSDPSSKTFGKVTSKTNTPRQLQLSLRYSF